MLIGFKAQFAGKVASGRKRCTIRNRRADVGELLHLYTGLRTKQARRLRKPIACRTCQDIVIYTDAAAYGGVFVHEETLAEQDGFSSFKEMAEFFRKTHGLPFCGYLITW